MIALLDTSETLASCEAELGVPVVEQLLTPLTRFKLQRPEAFFAIDNGAFAGFNREAFESLLERERPRVELCRWVACPDVVGSARRTLEAFDYWHDRLRDDGWEVALVAQDGIENLPIPWDWIDAIFKCGRPAVYCLLSATPLCKVHGTAEAIRGKLR